MTVKASVDAMPAGTTSGTPQVLLGHHLKQLKLPTVLREYDKVARETPPDKRSMAPATWEASCESNHRTAAAISSGCPMRPIGTRVTTRAGRSGSPAAA